MVQCDRCGGPTKPKTIISKKPETLGQSYEVYVCQGNCMNGKFKYSCFAPKVPNTTTPQVSQNGNGQKPSGESLIVLRSIDTSLKNILSILQIKAQQVPVQPNELGPDEEVPF